MGMVLWSEDENVKEFSILSKRFCSASHCCLPPPVAVDSPSRDVRRCAPPSISIDKLYKYFRQLYCPSAQCCLWATQACHTVPPHQ
ncbi:hypothetical protein TIFTF001_042994 [Ficus carica]|uniref:Uncharacterized protein n=2 Tax=Ficus carica TaxID=3494 RepID=A0AA87YQ11_FICCA|nr:hypothetical protein TIFTF001_042994 [Ficus carica]